MNKEDNWAYMERRLIHELTEREKKEINIIYDYIIRQQSRKEYQGQQSKKEYMSENKDMRTRRLNQRWESILKKNKRTLTRGYEEHWYQNWGTIE